MDGGSLLQLEMMARAADHGVCASHAIQSAQFEMKQTTPARSACPDVWKL